MFFNIAFRGMAPFISTRKALLKKIIDSLDIKDDSVVFELGCGKAGFLMEVYKKHPKTRVIGIENDLIPWMIAKIQDALTKKNFQIIKGNFYNSDLKEADFIYCYLLVEVMQKLETKFKKECKPGCIVVSYQFPMHGMEAYKVIEERNGRDKIYFYKM